MIGCLPKTLCVNGENYKIRTDFRDILRVITAFGDAELTDNEKIYVCLFVIYKDFDALCDADYGVAYEAAVNFIDCGNSGKNGKSSPRTMDWEQDENILFAAINKTAGFETRSAEYIHWWTFMGYFMEISDGVFSHVLSLRNKKAKHKKFEKHETEFWNANKDICVLRQKLSPEEQAKRDRLNALLN